MAKKHFQAEQIIGKLREAEVEISRGQTIGQVAKKLGITEQTYYRWRKEYGGLRTDQAKRLKEQEKQIARLKQVVANQALDMEIRGKPPRETTEPGETASSSRARPQCVGA
jgi:transposase-like protein